MDEPSGDNVMATDTNLQQAVDLKQLQLPPGLKVLSIEAEDYTDWDGDPAVRVNVVIDENTDVDHLPGDTINAFKRAIRDNLRKHGISLFAHFFFAKPSELADTGEG
jgi:hypothetical protein